MMVALSVKILFSKVSFEAKYRSSVTASKPPRYGDLVLVGAAIFYLAASALVLESKGHAESHSGQTLFLSWVARRVCSQGTAETCDRK